MMKTKAGKTILTLFVAVPVLLLLLAGIPTPLVSAEKEATKPVGRYQIAAWASYAGQRVHHSGYYVLDTATGKVVDSGHEVHGIGEDEGETKR